MILVVTELLLLSNKLSKAAGETGFLLTSFCIRGVVPTYTSLFVTKGVLDSYGSENNIYGFVKG